MNLIAITTLSALALLVTIGWLAERRAQLFSISLLSAFVVGWISWPSLLTLSVLTIATYSIAKVTRLKDWPTLAAIVTCCLAFVLYRLWTASGATFEPGPVVLLGFAFYILRAIHYLVESLQGRLPEHRFEHYFAYMFFLPTLTAGPIHRFPEFMRETRRRRFDSRLFSSGVERVVFGYGKVVVLGNYLVSTELHGFVQSLEPGRTALVAYLECVQYGLNLYFQFSGYSDVAIGVSAMLGIRILENFHWPFFQRNIQEFWNCWHISLSSWCRDYIYMPVVAHTRQPSIAILWSMLVLGLWHEFTARYLLWAVYHGVGLVVWRRWRSWIEGFKEPVLRSKWASGAADLSATVVTFHFVMFSFAITKEPSVTDALGVYGNLMWLGL